MKHKHATTPKPVDAARLRAALERRDWAAVEALALSATNNWSREALNRINQAASTWAFEVSPTPAAVLEAAVAELEASAAAAADQGRWVTVGALARELQQLGAELDYVRKRQSRVVIDLIAERKRRA